MNGRAAPDAQLLAKIEPALDARQARSVGSEIQFLCPAHDDHRPSARWNRAKAVWQCDACGGYLDLAERVGVLARAREGALIGAACSLIERGTCACYRNDLRGRASQPAGPRRIRRRGAR